MESKLGALSALESISRIGRNLERVPGVLDSMESIIRRRMNLESIRKAYGKVSLGNMRLILHKANQPLVLTPLADARVAAQL